MSEGKENSVRAVIRGREEIWKGRKTNNTKRSAIEMTLVKHSQNAGKLLHVAWSLAGLKTGKVRKSV